MKKLLMILLILTCTTAAYSRAASELECGKKIEITRQHSCWGDYDQYRYDGRRCTYEDINKILECSPDVDKNSWFKRQDLWVGRNCGCLHDCFLSSCLNNEGCAYYGMISLCFSIGFSVTDYKKNHWRNRTITAWGITGILSLHAIITHIYTSYYYPEAIKRYNDSIQDNVIPEEPGNAILEKAVKSNDEYTIIAFSHSF